MNLPDYRFTVISDIPRIDTLGSVGVEWTNSTVTTSTDWTNGTGGIIQCVGGTASEVLTRPITLLAGFRYQLIMYVTCINDANLLISNAFVTQYQYTVPIKGQPTPQVIACEFDAFASTTQSITLQVVAITSTVNFSFSIINVNERGGLIRVIQPGGWKTLTHNSERLVDFWGILETLDGQIEIFGDDWVWLKSYLATDPDKRFKCKIEIDPGTGFEDYFTGLLDTVGLFGTGQESTYKVTVPFLKDEEWSRFLSFLDTDLNVAYTKGINALDVIDSSGDYDRIQEPTDLGPRIAAKFRGEAKTMTANVSLSAEQILYLGFNFNVSRNDGYVTFNGLSNAFSLTVDEGSIGSIIGEIRLIFTKDAGIDVECTATNTGYTTLTSNAIQAINTQNVPAGFEVRLRNTTNAAKNFRITGVSYLDISSGVFTGQIDYSLRPLSSMPLTLLKAFTARIFGEYDNLIVPVFEDGQAQICNFDFSVITALQNPPLLYRPFNRPIVLGEPPVLPGNFYYQTGSYNPFDWIMDVGFVKTTSNDATFTRYSNMLLVRNRAYGRDQISTKTFTSRFTKGNYDVLINGSTIGVASARFFVYGVLDKKLTLLNTTGTVNGGFSLPRTIVVDKYYDGIGIIAEMAGPVQVNVTIFNVTCTAYPTRGKYALNSLSTGLLVKTPSSQTEFSPDAFNRQFGSTLRGLATIFGLGMEFTIVNDRPVLTILETVQFFKAFEAGPQNNIYAEDYEIGLDSQIIRDNVAVGGPIREEQRSDDDASCAAATYTTTYITTRQESDLKFDITLNPPLILNKEVGNNDLCLFELSQRATVANNIPTLYRTSDGLTITGSPSPRQPNWKHSEGRLVRRNIGILSSMDSPYFRLTSGVASTLVAVDAGDGLGAISDADVIFQSALFTPWLIKFSTAMTYLEFKSIVANKYYRMNLIVAGVTRTAYLKSMKYNAALGKAQMEVWLVVGGDFNLDFSNDFNVTPIPITI